MSLGWEQSADGVFRCRLPFLDVTVGLICGRDGVVLIDSGSTLPEARAIAGDVHSMACRAVSHIVLTHHHFDHILGASAFKTPEIYCAPQVGVTMRNATTTCAPTRCATAPTRGEVDPGIAALRVPQLRRQRPRRLDGLGQPSRSRPYRPRLDRRRRRLRPGVVAVDAGVEDAVFVPGLVQWSMLRSSADSRRDSSADCDEFQSPNVA